MTILTIAPLRRIQECGGGRNRGGEGRRGEGGGRKSLRNKGTSQKEETMLFEITEAEELVLLNCGVGEDF